MFQSVDIHALQAAGRFASFGASDAAAFHRHEIMRLRREERRARWLARRERLRAWIARAPKQRSTTYEVEAAAHACA